MNGIELILAEKNSGTIFELSACIENIEYTTNRTGSAGKLSFTLIKGGGLSFTEGDSVRFSVDGVLVFFGWVFSKSKNRWGEIDVVCYDRLRYLKSNGSYALYGKTASEILKTVAADFQLNYATIEDTGYKIPSFVQQDKSGLDIINEAINQTLLNTGKMFVLYDNGNGICLQEARNIIAPIGDIILGDKSLITDYEYKTSIDTQTYNAVRIYKADEEKGRIEAVEAKDSNTIAQWGLLRLYQQADENENTAQMLERAKATLKFYNQRSRTLSASSVGVVGLRAGMLARMQIQGLGDMDLQQFVLLERVSHKWESGKHTMDFDTGNYGLGVENGTY